MTTSVDFLLERQMDDGGWGYSVNNRDSFTEPTAWAAATLRRCGPRARVSVNRATEFFKSTQNDDGGWANVPGMPSDLMTARVVFAMATSPGFSSAVARGVEWVRQQELSSGGWGWCYGTTGFIETATYGVVALSVANRLDDRPRRIEYVLNLACTDGGWCSHVPAKLGFQQTSQLSVTPLGIVALATMAAPDEMGELLRKPLALVRAWVAERRLVTPYSQAMALWALTLAGAVRSATDLATAAKRSVSGDASWAGSVLHTAMMLYALQELELVQNAKRIPQL